MVPFKSCKTFQALEPNFNQDLISNLPDIVIDKILKRLSIEMVAKMSTLSRKWRNIWLSLKYLIFDKHFWDKLEDDGFNQISRCNCIISNILFHHVGPVHEFYLYYAAFYEDELYVHGWVSLLSKIGVKKITITIKSDDYEPMPSSIYYCKDMVKLGMEGLTLNRPPSHFKGFANLLSLELISVVLRHDVFSSLISNCPRLRRLIVTLLPYWATVKHSIVIDAPNLEQLTIDGDFDTIVFKNVQRLSSVSLSMDFFDNVIVQGVDHSIKMLANSSQLQDLHFNGRMCKYFSAGCNKMSFTLKFLQKILLTNLDLSDFDEFCFTLAMIKWCPFMEDLAISVNSKKCQVKHEYNYNKNCELRHLVKVKMTGIKGSNPELKLIEYMLSMASKLEKMVIKCSCRIDKDSMLKVAQELLKMPRASTKAKIDCL